MSELIDRQAFIENERKLYCEDCDRRKGKKNGKLTVCYEIGEAPCRACWLDDALGDLEDFQAASPWHRVEEPPKKTGKYAACWIYQEKIYWDWLIFIDGNWVLQAGLPLPDSGLPLPDYWMPIEPPKEKGE